MPSPYEYQQIAKTGALVLDIDPTLPKNARAGLMSSAITIAPEAEKGHRSFGIKNISDPANAMHWENDHSVVELPRGGASSWSFGMPARHLGKSVFQPLGTFNAVSSDFLKLPVHILGNMRVPIGTDVVVFATSGHGTPDKVAIAAGVSGPIIAQHLGGNPPEFSTHVHEIDGDKIDQVRHAGLDTLVRVRKWAAPCSGNTSSGPQEFTIALVGNTSPDGMGYIHVTFGDIDAAFSHMASGPLIPSFSAKHQLSDTGDAPLVAGAISTKAYFRGSKMPFTAPLRFEEQLYPPVQNGTINYEVHRQYDPAPDHPFLCKSKKGEWREFVKLPIGETPPCTPTKDYSAVDTQGNPKRTFASESRTFITKRLQSTGIYFQSRPNLLQGRRP